MIDIILPFVEETEMMKKTLLLLGEFTPKKVGLILVKDTKKEGADKMFSDAWENSNNDVILWHTDILPTKNWLENLLKWIKKLPKDAGIIGTKLLYPDGTIQHYGGFLDKQGVGRHIGRFGLDLNCFNQPMEVDFVTFGGVYIKRKVINELGRMDSLFYPTYYGDVDYCFRAREKGFKIFVVPVPLIHYETQDNKKLYKSKMANIMGRNHERFIAKWMDKLSAVVGTDRYFI